MKQVCLLTGTPGTGKTSLIKRVVDGMGEKAGGFYTEEIRNFGIRQGFRLITLDGESAVLAHVNISSRFRVGKYGVDINNLERIGVPCLQKAVRQCDLVVVDEIGRMELLSDGFCKAIYEIIKSGKKVLGTIMLNSHHQADDIKNQPEV